MGEKTWDRTERTARAPDVRQVTASGVPARTIETVVAMRTRKEIEGRARVRRAVLDSYLRHGLRN